MIKRNLRNTSTNIGQLPYLTSSGFVATIVTGSISLFQQTTAPVGWTKLTAHDNKALRVVSGTASSGGTTAFSTVFTTLTSAITAGIGSTTLDATTMPSHTHLVSAASRSVWVLYQSVATVDQGSGAPNSSSAPTGGGQSHTHASSGSLASSLDMAVQYVDIIMASKN